MTKVLENLIDRVSRLPRAAQEELVRSVVDIERRHSGVYVLSDIERDDILAALDEMRRGEVASDEEASAVFERLTA